MNEQHHKYKKEEGRTEGRKEGRKEGQLVVSGSLDTTHAFEVLSLYVVFVSFNWINIFFVHSICLLGVF